MNNESPLRPFFRRLEEFSTLRWTGRVTKAIGQLVESDGPFCSVGEGCAILTEDGHTFSGEIVGFRGRTVLSMPLERPSGIRYGDRIVTRGTQPSLRVGPAMLGRVIDGTGKPIDNQPNYRHRSIGHCRETRQCRWSAHRFVRHWAAAFARSMAC